MNTRRKVAWLAFFGVCGLVAWMPEQFFGEQAQDATADAQLSSGKRSDAGLRTAAAGKASAADSAATPRVLVVPQVDLFASQNWYVAPVMTAADQAAAALNSAPAAPLVPTAPPLPFQFIGKLEDRQQLQVFLQNGERLYVVRAGDVIDEVYKIDHISATEMSFVYLPLKFAQTLSVGSAP